MGSSMIILTSGAMHRAIKTIAMDRSRAPTTIPLVTLSAVPKFDPPLTGEDGEDGGRLGVDDDIDVEEVVKLDDKGDVVVEIGRSDFSCTVYVNPFKEAQGNEPFIDGRIRVTLMVCSSFFKSVCA